jgi:hypothetical protein
VEFVFCAACVLVSLLGKLFFSGGRPLNLVRHWLRPGVSLWVKLKTERKNSLEQINDSILQAL